MMSRNAFVAWLFPCISLLLLLSALRIVGGKLSSFVAVQQLTDFPLFLWKFITIVGDGAFAGCMVVYFAIRKMRLISIHILLAWLIGAGVVQSLKHFVYKDRLRPVEWFQKHEIQLEIPDGHEPYRTHSFPSGHTATAFGIWGMLAYHSKRRIAGFAFAVITVLAAWSRIALFQHFPADVVAGGLIGTCSIFAALWISRKCEAKFPHLLTNQ